MIMEHRQFPKYVDWVMWVISSSRAKRDVNLSKYLPDNKWKLLIHHQK